MKQENLLDENNILKQLYAKNLELYKERSRIHEIIQQVAEIVFAVDQDLKITLFNKTAEQVFGVSQESALGKVADTVVKIFRKDISLWVGEYAFKKDSLISDINKESITMTDSLGNKSYYRLKFANLDLEMGSRECVVTLTNITREVEEDKRKDEFISITGHELKTPVAIVKNNLWMFRYLFGKNAAKAISARQKQLLDDTFEELIRLNKLITDLLDLSRIAQNRLVLNIRDCAFDPIIQDIDASFSTMAKKKGLAFSCPKKGFGQVRVDKERLYEVFENLLSNAFKYTGNGFVKIAIAKNRGFLKISISDSGAGISEKDRSKMFTKFGRGSEGLKVHDVGASTGLGLYVTKNLVEQMGGSIDYKSEKGKGSIFWFTIKRV